MRPPLAVAVVLLVAASAHADEAFEKEVRPLLVEKCVGCHGPKKARGGLRLDTMAGWQKGGDGGPAVVPGKPDESLVIKAIHGKDGLKRMPPEGKLQEDEIAALTRWIKDGANDPRDDAKIEVVSHWSFRPPARPTVPAVWEVTWVRQPIDAFIMARLEKEGIAPSTEAPRHTLIRRLHLDLIGLPPSPDEVDAFVADAAPDAYERLVDRLLSSPHFGERWGRHWLDLARYAESDGYENDKLRPDAWRWRDWVVRSFNADQPYDRFTIEQLAGDLLPDATLEQKLATGLHRNTLYNSAASGDKEEFRTYAIKDRTETTAGAWMGLTLACASCHAHKYDPISLGEYYSFYAFFNATADDDLPVPGEKGKGRIMALKAAARDTHVFLRGNYLQRGAKVSPDMPAFLPQIKARGKVPDRLDLARWLVREDHPLTARVAANRIWQHLFGASLVGTPENFGTSGEPPSHPDLLDWLAGEFVRLNWSRKALVRRVVLSSAYRQASIHRADLKSRDPANRLLARQNRFRVEAEVVHDLALAVSGLLQPRIGGPSFVPPFPRELPVSQFTAEELRQPTKERHLRGIYIHVQRTLTHPVLGAFDVADGNQPCARRARSATAVQALALLNDPTYAESAKALGARLLREPSDNRLSLAFRLAIGRSPGRDEREVLAELVESQRRRGAKDDAVWAGVARVLLNLEEFTTRE